MSPRTPSEVKEEFLRRGLSISAWALAQGFSAPLVYQVLAGRRGGVRGQSHDIALALGLKTGLPRTHPLDLRAEDGTSTSTSDLPTSAEALAS